MLCVERVRAKVVINEKLLLNNQRKKSFLTSLLKLSALATRMRTTTFRITLGKLIS